MSRIRISEILDDSKTTLYYRCDKCEYSFTTIALPEDIAVTRIKVGDMAREHLAEGCQSGNGQDC